MKRKVCVSCVIDYWYETEVDDEIDGEPIESWDYPNLCDNDDPVYSQITRILRENKLDYEGRIIAVRDDTTDEELWAE